MPYLSSGNTGDMSTEMVVYGGQNVTMNANPHVAPPKGEHVARRSALLDIHCVLHGLAQLDQKHAEPVNLLCV